MKSVNDTKGFGYVTQNDGDPDLFVRRTAVNGDALMEGDEVTESPYTTNA